MTIHFGQDIAYEALDSQIEMLTEPQQPEEGTARGFWALFSVSAIAAVVQAVWGAL